MLNRLKIHFASGLMLAASCCLLSFAVPVSATEPTITTNELEMIQKLLSLDDDTKLPKHVFEEKTSVEMLHIGTSYEVFSETLRKSAGKFDASFKEAVEDFIAKNASNSSIVFPTNGAQNLEVAPETTLKEIFSPEHNAKGMGWYFFYKFFPGTDGLLTISHVGMDSKHTVALIYLGQKKRYHVGGGRIRILRKQYGVWVLENSEPFGPEWVS